MRCTLLLAVAALSTGCIGVLDAGESPRGALDDAPPSGRSPARGGEDGDDDDAPPFVSIPPGQIPGPGAVGEPPDEGWVTTAGDVVIDAQVQANGDIALSWNAVEGATAVRVAFGAEPPTASGLPDPSERADLDGAATTHVITSVAPGMTVFVQLTAATAEGPLAGWAAVRTPSGYEALGPLTHVFSYGTDVLLVEVRDASIAAADAQARGERWASGAWRVLRHDGSAIEVTSVHRRTQVIGQPSYPVGFDRYGENDVVDVTHSIYLSLGEAVGSPELLKVEHDDDVSAWVPFSDSYIETPVVQVNQVGYNARATRRWAYVSGYMGDGGALDPSRLPATADVIASSPSDTLQPRAVVASGLAVATRSANDAHAGGAVRQIDLSTLPADEDREYRVRLPGVGVSFRTGVNERAAEGTYYTVARGLFHNRWCGNLAAEYTAFSRPEDHCSAYFVTGRSYEEGQFEEGTATDDMRPLRGGHHDAGDFDIRPFHVLVGQYLMRAVELGGAALTDGQLRIPESGNGIPDLLDEALWSLEGWRALQNDDGSVRAGVESTRDPAGIYPANEDQLKYFTYDPEPWHTAYVAALFAQGARLVRPYDAARAGVLEAAARAAYGSPIATDAPTSYRMYAASELAALTGEESFVSDFEEAFHSLDRDGHGAFDAYDEMFNIYPGGFVEHTPVMGDFVMGYATSSVADPAVLAIITEAVRQRADTAASRILDSAHAHRNGLPEGRVPDWGALASTGRHVDAIYQALQLGGLPSDVKQRYFDATSVSADYALGANPAGTTYLTGLGTHSPRQVLHLDSLSGMQSGRPPIPGIPVYGPVNEVPAAGYYDAFRVGFHPALSATPLGLRLVDSRTFVTSSEFTVWENQAPFAELFAALMAVH